MKTKLWMKLAAGLAALCAGTGFAACDNSASGAGGAGDVGGGSESGGAGGESTHVHAYDKENVTEKYLASAATCTAKAKYYYSCECGEAGTDTFEYGEVSAEHPFAEEWSKDENKHFHKSECVHDLQKDRANHEFDAERTCEICGYMESAPMGLVVCVDRSGSMAEKLESVRQGLISCYYMLSESDYIGIVSFDGNGTVLPLTSVEKTGEILKAVSGDFLKTSDGGANLYAGLLRAGEMLKNCEQVAKKHIIVVSDGGDNGRGNFLIDEAKELAQRGISVSVVLTGEPSEETKANMEKLVAPGKEQNLAGNVGVEDGGNLKDLMRGQLSEKRKEGSGEVEHVHAYDKENVTEKYLASAATCTEKAKYYYSCECGEAGTDTFEYGEVSAEHPFTEEWNHDANFHFYKSECVHGAVKGKSRHDFNAEHVCEICGYETSQPVGAELQSSFFTFDEETGTWRAKEKLPNAAEEYDFNGKFTVAYGARFEICTDKRGRDTIPSRIAEIDAGDNVFYVLVTNGNDVAIYTVTLRRRPLYTVSYDTAGGSAVENEEVEEDGFAAGTGTTSKLGCAFDGWDYDFTQPIESDTTIAAKYSALPETVGFEFTSTYNTFVITGVKDKGITSATVPDYTTGFGKSAFDNCRDLESVNFPEKLVSIGKYAFRWCEKLTEIELPQGVVSIGEGAFQLCRGLKAITIPDSVISIGCDAFNACIVLESIKLPKNLEKLESQTFKYCEKLTTIEFSEKLQSIGEGCFWDCLGLTELEIPASVTSFGKDAFAWCRGLTSVTISGKAEEISEGLFNSCDNLVSVRLPEGVQSIGERSLAHCVKLSSVNIPQSVEELETYAFYNCPALTSIEIPKSVKRIGEQAFGKYSQGEELQLAKVYYGGTAEEWEEIEIGSGNETLIAAERYYYSESKPDDEVLKYWYRDEKDEIKEWFAAASIE